MNWDAFSLHRTESRLPAAFIDLDALIENVRIVRETVASHGKTVRVATKSVRHTGLLRRILELGGPTFQGLMCYSVPESIWLAEQGFDDLLVAYPTVQSAPLAALAQAVAKAHQIRLVVDHPAQLAALGQAGVKAGVELAAVVELDMSYRPVSSIHLGVRRSPLRLPEQVVALAKQATDTPGVCFGGLMAYEAQIAGLPDRSPFHRLMNPARRLIKSRSRADVARRREETVHQLAQSGQNLELVNGGGTGSLLSTRLDTSVTEITVGSGFLCSHLFDHYDGLPLQPAAFFALEVTRTPAPGYVTCAGGGYIASGEPGQDRLPQPWHPRGLSLLPMEGAGEVQTPLRVPPAVSLQAGDPVIFRHAKAGELAERFEEYILLRQGEVVGVEPTYRGQGQCFL